MSGLAARTALASPAAASPLARYVGEYHNDYYGTISITEKDGKLIVAMGPKGGYTFTSRTGTVMNSRSCQPAGSRPR